MNAKLTSALKGTKREIGRTICIACVFIFSLLPLLFLVFNITSADASFVFHDKNFFESIKNSLIYSISSALIATILALIAAYLLNTCSCKFKKILVFFLTFGMLVPTLSIGLGIRELFGKKGFLDVLFGIQTDASGWFGLIFGSVIVAFPSTFLIIYDTLRYEDKRPYDVAEIMGISKISTFFRLTLPFLKTALISAFFAAFTLIFADYGIPMEAAGKIKTLPMYLYSQITSTYKYGRGSIAGLVLLTPAIVSFFFNVFAKEDKGTEKSKPLSKRSKIYNIVSVVVIVAICVILFVPQISFISLAFMKNFPRDTSFTLEHFKDFFGGGYGTSAGIGEYLTNSLIIAFLTAIIGTVFAYILAYYTTRKKGVLGKILHLLSISSIAIPGLVLGVGYIFLFKSTRGFFYGTVAILVAVNIFHFLGSPYLMAKNCLDKINKDYEVTGDTLGVSRFGIFIHVLVPQSKTTLLEMFSYFFINSMVTISAVSFLCSFFNKPLAVMINTYEKSGNYEMQAVISVIILAVNIFAKLFFTLIKLLLDKKITFRRKKSMALTRYKFDLLTFLDSNGTKKYSQRYLSDELTLSVGTINKIIKELVADGLVQYNDKDELEITENGYKALEPYKVRKAIILAAGFGSRLAPVTLKTPKPLIEVNGVRIIDTLIDALIAQGITNIIIVRGYLKEKFDVLKKKYPTITFVDNELFNRENNISSLVKAIDYVDRCYICEADLLISNPDIIKKYQFSSNYLAAKVKETDDWCFDKVNGYIGKFRQGGEDCYQEFGISYWNEEDSAKLREYTIKTYNSRGGKEKFWDFAPLVNHKNSFKIEIRPCHKQDIVEIDNFYELVAIDSSYENYPDSDKY